MSPARVGVVVFALLWSMSTHGKPSSSGDEPYYLMVSQSLLVDHDLDLANNFAANQGSLVGADDLEPGAHAKPTRSGALWSTHDIGLSVLILPAYAIGSSIAQRIPEDTLAGFRMSRGRFAYSVVSLFFSALTACAATLFAAALGFNAPRIWAAGVTLAVVLSPPILSHGFLVFPEIPALLVTCAVVWIATMPSARLRFGTVFTVVALLGVTPWIHRKFSFFVVGLAFVLWRQRREWLMTLSRGRWAALTAAFIAPQLALHVVTLVAWGRLGGPQMLGALPFGVAGFGIGAMGLLLDRSRGLLGYGPIYLLVPIIWTVAGRRYLDWLVPVACLFIPMAAFVTWDGGYSPAARFLVPLMPVLALPSLATLEQRWIRWAALGPLLLQLFLSGYSWGHPRVLWPGEVGDNRALNAVPVVGSSLNRMLPVLNQGTWR